MQNKANFKKGQMSTTFYEQKDCEEKMLGVFRKNKAKTKPVLRLSSEPALSLSKGQVSNVPLLKWVITRENALDLMASAAKNAYLIGLNKNRKNRIRQANAAVYAFD